MLKHIITALLAVPLCMGQSGLVPCWSAEKIEQSYHLLHGKYDRGYIASIEMNRGKFSSAKALADWIRYGDSR